MANGSAKGIPRATVFKGSKPCGGAAGCLNERQPGKHLCKPCWNLYRRQRRAAARAAQVAPEPR